LYSSDIFNVSGVCMHTGNQTLNPPPFQYDIDPFQNEIKNFAHFLLFLESLSTCTMKKE